MKGAKTFTLPICGPRRVLASPLKIIFATMTMKPCAPLYRKHAMGNSLFQNVGEGFADVGAKSGTTMGRWSWSSDAWDFNHDGFPDLYIANGMVFWQYSRRSQQLFSGARWLLIHRMSPGRTISTSKAGMPLTNSFDLATPGAASSEMSSTLTIATEAFPMFQDLVGLDFLQDSRTFALGDFDRDGRLEVVLKNRNSPQLLILKNVLPELPPAISFRLSGKKSNRDARRSPDHHRNTPGPPDSHASNRIGIPRTTHKRNILWPRIRKISRSSHYRLAQRAFSKAARPTQQSPNLRRRRLASIAYGAIRQARRFLANRFSRP